MCLSTIILGYGVLEPRKAGLELNLISRVFDILYDLRQDEERHPDVP